MKEPAAHSWDNDLALPKIDDLIGDRYRVTSTIGKGGFAVVYEALDLRTDQVVAVKVVDPVMSRQPDIAERFRQEVRAVTRLRHHHTIKVYDTGVTESACLYLVMERLHGEPLDDALAGAGRMPPARVKHIAAQVLKSLIEAHDAGIIHRDLKPANIFLVEMAGERDYVKVLDFGIAKSLDDGHDTSLTQTGAVVCSPNYVAPERVSKNITTPGSDIYSLGVLMIELLEGRAPYRGETPMALMLQHLRLDDPVPIAPQTAAGPLGEVLRRATDKDASVRYQDAREMLDDLLAVDAAGTVDTSTTRAATEQVPRHMVTRAMPDEPQPARSDSRGAIVAIAAVLIAAAAGLFWLVTSESGEPAEETDADTIETSAVVPVAAADSAAAVVIDAEGSADTAGTAQAAGIDETVARAQAQAGRHGRVTATETRLVAMQLALTRAAEQAAPAPRDVVVEPAARGTAGTVPFGAVGGPDTAPAGLDQALDAVVAPAPTEEEPPATAEPEPPSTGPDVEPPAEANGNGGNRFGSTDRPR